jgi:hypothetical protein
MACIGRETHRRLLAMTAMALIFSGCLAWRVLPVVAANGKSLGTKFVDVDAVVTRFDAVVITKVTVAGQEIQPGRGSGAREDAPGTPFQADEDWLKNMSIFIKNRTDQVIVCAEVDLVFPETGDGTSQPVTSDTLSVGQRPEWSRYVFDGTREELRLLNPREPLDATRMRLTPLDPTKKPLSLAPGKTLEIRVADYIEQIQSTVEDPGTYGNAKPFSQITRVNVERRTFYFENGMRWDIGTYAVPLENHPGYYTNLTSGYFPGDATQYPARE